MNINLKADFELIEKFNLEQGDSFSVDPQGRLNIINSKENAFNSSHHTVLEYFKELSVKTQEKVKQLETVRPLDGIYKDHKSYRKFSKLTMNLSSLSKVLSTIARDCKESDQEASLAFDKLANGYQLQSRDLLKLDKIENIANKVKENEKSCTWQAVKKLAVPIFVVIASCTISVGAPMVIALISIPPIVQVLISLSCVIVNTWMAYKLINSISSSSLQKSSSLESSLKFKINRLNLFHQCLDKLLSFPIIGEEQIKTIEEIAHYDHAYFDAIYCWHQINKIDVVSTETPKDIDELFAAKEYWGPKKNEFGEGALKAIRTLFQDSGESCSVSSFNNFIHRYKTYFQWIDNPETNRIAPSELPIDWEKIKSGKEAPKETGDVLTIAEKNAKWAVETSVEERCEFLLHNFLTVNKIKIPEAKVATRPIISPEHFSRLIKVITSNPKCKTIYLDAYKHRFLDGTGFTYDKKVYTFQRQ